VPKAYPPEFRRGALDLVASGRLVREVAAMLGIAESCLHRWKSPDLVDRGVKSPTPEIESAALKAARERITELENEVKILRKAAAAVEEVVVPQKHGSPSSPNWPMREYRSSRPASPSGCPDQGSMTPGAVHPRPGRSATCGCSTRSPPCMRRPGRPAVPRGSAPSSCTAKASSSPARPLRR
jgi:transposase-like protein